MASTDRRESVSARVVASLVIMLFAFAGALGLATLSLHQATEQMDDLSTGMVPLALRLTHLKSLQETTATLVDGMIEERSASATRSVVASLLKERAALFEELDNLCEELAKERSETKPFTLPLRAELRDIADTLSSDNADVEGIAQAFSSGDFETATRVLEHFTLVEHEAQRRLAGATERLSSGIGRMAGQARKSERRSLFSVLGASVLALALGLALSLRIRRLLSPLAEVLIRARAVAQGDLTPKHVVPAADELGELQRTFEDMVGAVAKAREAAVSNERFAAIGKMAAHVTHEVRNPLTSIGLNLEMLEEDLPHDKESRSLVSAIRVEVERLERISEDYLRVARLPSPRFEADDMAASVRQIIDFERRDMDRAGCRVHLEVSSPPPTAQFDEAQLRQALLNLLRNARESMSGGGGDIEVRVFSEGLSGVVTVADRGAGIADETQAKMFDPFFSTKGEGTGLGLAITRQIIEAHGGTITFSAREGGGSVFRIMLPLTSAL
jgi:two-component system, NtrC family, sensor kinase